MKSSVNMHRRYKKQKNRKQQRHKKWPLVLLLLVVLLVTAFILLRFIFVVRSVEISGSVEMSSEEVVRRAHIGFGESIFTIDEDEIRRAVNSAGSLRYEGLEPVYPDTLILQVSQRRPAAMAFHSGKLLILDSDACAMQSLDSAPDADMVFASDFDIMHYTIGETVSADDGQIADYRAIMQAIEYHGAAGYVSEIQVENTNDLRLITRRGIEVKLGNRENMKDKIAWMKSAVADLENRGERGGLLDVSSGTKADYRASNN